MDENNRFTCKICNEIKEMEDLSKRQTLTCKNCVNEKRNEKILCECGKYYTRNHASRHKKSLQHNGIKVKCDITHNGIKVKRDICNKEYKYITKHYEYKHKYEDIFCENCGKTFRKKYFKNHVCQSVLI